MKKAALLIFEAAGDVIDMSRHVKKAILLRLTPLQTQISLTLAGERHTVENNLYCSLYMNRSFKKSTSKFPWMKQSNWPVSEDLTILHTTSINSEYYGKDVALIELRKGSPVGDSIILGQISIEVAEITSKLELNGSETVSYNLSTTDFLERGTLLLKHSIVAPPNEVIVQKRLEISEKLKGLSFWIKKVSVGLMICIHVHIGILHLFF